jgi:NMD protein affecting ribosome stability and mRNA decay
MMGLPTCREVAAQLSREQDAAEPTPHRLSLRLHLMMCRHCRRYERQLVWLRQSLIRVRADDAEPKLPARAQARIRAGLRHDDNNKQPPV